LHPSSILIRGATVVTMDEKRRIIKNGCVFIEHGRIQHVGREDEVREKADLEIHAKSMVALPGLIDCHVHLAQAILRGVAEDLPLIEWLTKKIWPLQGSYTKEEGVASAKLCMLEMIKSGTTTFLESGLHPRYGIDEIAQVAVHSGLRAFLSRMIMEGSGYASQSGALHPGLVESGEQSFSDALRLHKKWDGREGGRIKFWFALRSLGAVTKSVIEQTCSAVRELSSGVTMHLAEVKEDVEYSKKQFGVTPLEFVKSAGMLQTRSVFAHMVWLENHEIEALSKSASSVAHCPSSNCKLGSGVAKTYEMTRARVNVALGTDGAPCNNSHDLFREMRLTSFLQRARLLDPTVMGAQTVLEMATINGARALGIDHEVGSLEKGKKADLILVDLSKPHTTPSPDIAATLVYSASGCDVDTVIVDGKLLMQNRRVLTIDEEQVLKQANEALLRVLDRI